LDPKRPSLRSEFLHWAETNLGTKALFLLAESTYPAATRGTSKFLNLTAFESTLAQLSNCVLIFPESPGAFCELGIFSEISRIREKTLIANDSSHEKDDSFLLLGPFHAINSTSKFYPTVGFDSTVGIDPTFKERIWKRIADRTRGFDEKRAPEQCHFAEMPLDSRIAIISWVLDIVARATVGDLLDIVRGVYGSHKADSRRLRETLRISVPLGQAIKKAPELYAAPVERAFGLVTTVDELKLKSQFRNFWMREFPIYWAY
jgi:hypothetical protein